MNRLLFLFILFLLLFGPHLLFAQNTDPKTSKRFMTLIEQTEQLEQNQQQILKTQSELIKKIKEQLAST